VQDEAIYRCINAACARGMPRRVNYCPYCGTAQQPGAHAPSQDDGRVRRDAAVATAAAAGAEAVAGLSGWSDASDTVPAAPPKPAPKPAPTPSATAFGHSGRPVDAATAAPERGRGIPWPPPPAPPDKPPGRQPIRLRWWIVALAVLWGVWLWSKPSAKKIDRRIDAAIALAQSCQGKQAQDELIALRAGRASPEQLERLQRALNEASNACTRKRGTRVRRIRAGGRQCRTGAFPPAGVHEALGRGRRYARAQDPRRRGPRRASAGDAAGGPVADVTSPGA
jgi:hypothetical protein